MLFALYQKQQQVIANATVSTKATRRRAEADRRSATPTPTPPSVSAIDFTLEAAELPMEIWDQPP
jgi:hypothetical protein